MVSRNKRFIKHKLETLSLCSVADNSKITSAVIDIYNKATIEISYCGISFLLQEEDSGYSVLIRNKDKAKWLEADKVYSMLAADSAKKPDFSRIAKTIIDDVRERLEWGERS